MLESPAELLELSIAEAPPEPTAISRVAGSGELPLGLSRRLSEPAAPALRSKGLVESHRVSKARLILPVPSLLMWGLRDENGRLFCPSDGASHESGAQCLGKRPSRWNPTPGSLLWRAHHAALSNLKASSQRLPCPYLPDPLSIPPPQSCLPSSHHAHCPYLPNPGISRQCLLRGLPACAHPTTATTAGIFLEHNSDHASPSLKLFTEYTLCSF